MSNGPEKTCPNCEEFLKLGDFHKDKNSKDGRTSWCKVCTKGYMKDYNLRKKAEREKKAKKAKTVVTNKVSVGCMSGRITVKESVLPEFSYKTCSKCSETKNLKDGFHKNKKSKDGHASQCKECKKAARKK